MSQARAHDCCAPDLHNAFTFAQLQQGRIKSNTLMKFTVFFPLTWETASVVNSQYNFWPHPLLLQEFVNQRPWKQTQTLLKFSLKSEFYFQFPFLGVTYYEQEDKVSKSLHDNLLSSKSSPNLKIWRKSLWTHFPVHHQCPSCWTVLWRSLTINRHNCVSTSKETLFQNSRQSLETWQQLS